MYTYDRPGAEAERCRGGRREAPALPEDGGAAEQDLTSDVA